MLLLLLLLLLLILRWEVGTKTNQGGRRSLACGDTVADEQRAAS